jgi:predicted transcriptional regulator
MRQMTTKEALATLRVEQPRVSGYRLAKLLKISAIMITRYRRGDSAMGLETARKFAELYGIEIIDARTPGRQLNENY